MILAKVFFIAVGRDLELDFALLLVIWDLRLPQNHQLWQNYEKRFHLVVNIILTFIGIWLSTTSISFENRFKILKILWQESMLQTHFPLKLPIS